MKDDLTKPMARSITKFVKRVENDSGPGYISDEENQLHQDNVDLEMEDVNDDNGKYKKEQSSLGAEEEEHSLLVVKMAKSLVFLQYTIGR